MARTVSIGNQDFEAIRKEGYFYIDKTNFIQEWWENGDSVTLITRPRRFGKTLNLSMLEKFFSVNYKDRSDLFEGLSIWAQEKYRSLQGTYPVLFLSFAGIKENSYAEAKQSICRIIEEQYNKHDYLLKGNLLNEKEKTFFQKVSADMPDNIAAAALRSLSDYLCRYYGKKALIFLDEYDTPMQEAYVNGYWKELVSFTRNLFNSAFKTNPYLERAVMTGITRVSKESIFSDLNNLKVVTTTSRQYADCFGFTEEEVFAALDEFDLSGRKRQVKDWYDGFTFGSRKDIYNPWSIINFLNEKRVDTYWANTSSNSLIGKLVRVTSEIFSYFDTGRKPSEEEPERFYHGFVLGLMVELTDRYQITSNRESGFGRYDVMLEPRQKSDNAIILEFKVQDTDEKSLADTAQNALQQIEEKDYQANLSAKGILKERIRKYGFAFCGKKVLIAGSPE